MANKYLIHGATYCGDGTASNEAASAGAAGAWNDINVFEGAATGQVPVPSQYTSPNTHDICDISLVYLVMQSIPRPTRPAEVKSTPNDNPKNQRQKIASMLLLLAA